MQERIGDILHQIAFAQAEIGQSMQEGVVNWRDFEKVLVSEFGLIEPEVKNLI